MTRAQIVVVIRDAANIADVVTDLPRGSCGWEQAFALALPAPAREVVEALESTF